jgi:hypothetical protein
VILQPKTLAFGLNTADPQQLKQQLSELPADSLKALMDASQRQLLRRLALNSGKTNIVIVSLYLLFLIFVLKPFDTYIKALIVYHAVVLVISLSLLRWPTRRLFKLLAFFVGLGGVWNIVYGTLNGMNIFWIITGVCQLIGVRGVVKLLHRTTDDGDSRSLDALRTLRTTLWNLPSETDPDAIRMHAGKREYRLVLLPEIVVVLHDKTAEAQLLLETDFNLRLLVSKKTTRRVWAVDAKITPDRIAAQMPREYFERYATWKQTHHPDKTPESLQLVGTKYPDWVPVSPVGQIMLLALVALAALFVFYLFLLALM